MGLILVAVLALVAMAFLAHPTLKRVAFTAWVFVFVAASMVWPGALGSWFGFDLKYLIIPLVQILMFGMGTTLSVAGFTRVLAMRWPVVVGLERQYAIMPFVGFGLATAFGFEPEVAAGVILIGSAPGGVASNVISYLARCNGPVLNNALSGLDQALWDIQGKRAGMPVYQLLGGKCRFAVDCYAHSSGRDLAALENSVRRNLEEGFRHIRIQLGGYGSPHLSGEADFEKAGFGLPVESPMDAKRYLKATRQMFERIRDIRR